jgi:hypothetical protein
MKSMGYDLLDALPCDQNVTNEARSRGNLRADAAVSHGAGRLLTRGDLPPGSEFDAFRDVLSQRRQDALSWIGGEAEASCFDLDEVDAYARWGTAADIVWGVLQAEGIMTRTAGARAWLNWPSGSTSELRRIGHGFER